MQTIQKLNTTKKKQTA